MSFVIEKMNYAADILADLTAQYREQLWLEREGEEFKSLI